MKAAKKRKTGKRRHFMKTTKRITLTLVAVALFSSSGFGQSPNQPVEANLYLRALQAALEENAKAYGNIESRRDLHNVTVERNIEINSGFPEQIKSFRIKYLDGQGLVKRYKEKKEEFPIIVIRSMGNEGNRIVVNLADYWISYKENNLNYSLEGGSKVIFRYDCHKGEYVIEKVELWGV